MVLRCYSRRHLVPAWRSAARHTSALPMTFANASISSETRVLRNALSRPISSTAFTAAAKSHATRPADQNGSWSFFFPETIRWNNKSNPVPRSKHPFIKNLIAEIYSTSRDPAANRVWRAYMTVRETYETTEGTDGKRQTVSLLSQLEPVHYQQLLRAIDPAVARTRRLSRAESKRREAISHIQAASSPPLSTGTASSDLAPSSTAASTSAPTHQPASGRIVFMPPFNSAHSQRIFNAAHSVREYMRRVKIIFADMRYHAIVAGSGTGKQPSNLPALADYNHVLSRLASGGHIGPMSSIWNDITRSPVASDSAPLHPNKHTYRELMIGLSRHATDQIERVQKGEAAKRYQSSGKKRFLEKSARAAASGLARFGQVLAPSARAAAILAALRTMALLKDMKDHGVVPNQITLDFAARTLRLAGHIDGLLLLMRQAYGIDLSQPDSRIREGSSEAHPTIHTLNTILMALGEQATVPEMVTAYETLAKPLPTSLQQSQEVPDGGLFSTNWRDIFSSVRSRADEITKCDSSEIDSRLPTVFSYAHNNQIRPNTKTFEILLRHCCAEVDPLRSPVALKVDASDKPVAAMVKESTELAMHELQDGGERATEMSRRRKGDYTLFAKGLVQEALDRSQILLHQAARSLGIELVRSPLKPTTAASETQTEKAEASPAPDSQETQPRCEYLAFQVVPGRATEPFFLPILEPPSFSITAPMIEPLFSLASSKRGLGDLRWIRGVVSVALENKIAEAKILDAAWRTYGTRLQKTHAKHAKSLMTEGAQLADIHGDSSTAEQDPSSDLPPLALKSQSPSEVHAFLHRLRSQYRLATRQAQALEQMLYDRLDDRVTHLAQRRNVRYKNKIQAEREAMLQAEKDKLEQAEREATRKAQAAEARRLRALEKDQQDQSADLATSSNV
ncbi:hypothetical protein BCV70DRAFT_202975 [Testicularia cyperi]|uniref:Uncharacterized protein n=1 Tax=Testicularia cyperi TaxID=1882483 RepID=A0A317XJ62_9BASI|nr:hypothetical protein BCV70DRAFT_202975 [Testicularia cyperi]